MDLKKANNRDFSLIKGKESIIYLIKEYLENKYVQVKSSQTEKIKARLELVESDCTIRLWFDEIPPSGVIRDEVTVYMIAKRYIELKLKKRSYTGNLAEFDIIESKIAHSFRSIPRVDVEPEGFFADNLRLSKYSINPGITKAPICVQVAFDGSQAQMLKEFPGCEIGVLAEKHFSRDIQASLKSQKIVYVENILNEETFSPAEDIFLDYKSFLSARFDAELRALKEQGLKSILIYPVVYTNTKGEQTSVGYIKLTSKSEPISLSALPKLKDFAGVLSTNIRDSNIRIIKDPQKIINVSKNGLQLKLEDSDVIKVFKANSNEIVMDVKPDKKYTFVLYAQKASIYLDTNECYIIGMKLIGGEEKRGVSFWQKYIDRLIEEKNYRLTSTPIDEL